MQKRTDNFDKFGQKRGSAVKEEYRQAKKKIKAEARAAGEALRLKKKNAKLGIVTEEPKKAAPKFPKRAPGANKAEYHERKENSKNIGKPAPRSKPEAKDATPRDPEAPRSKRAGARPPKSMREAGFVPNKDGGKPGFNGRPALRDKDAQDKEQVDSNSPDTVMPLNKYIAHSGVCGRREAAELVKTGKVTVNGDKIFEPGYKVSGRDKVVVKDKQVFLQKNSVYILLNKPKDFLTTANDPQGRKTVMDIVKSATQERVYPVGRLDRNTTGVLLLTNDGEFAQKLTHPSYEVKKIYEVTLDKAVTKKDMESIVSGITLEDGLIVADSVAYADAKDKTVVGIEIHSGRNRIVRRIFEHLGYDVKNLDRVMFANLTKKNVERGKFRFLNEKEVRLLKFMNKAFVRKSANTISNEDTFE
jgi:23S rRNA pseudouridine2605 synthase